MNGLFFGGLFGSKRAAGHFEMIFSFVFFIGFVFFLFVVLKPQDTSILSGSVIEALYDSFREEVYTNLSAIFLKTNYDGDEECFKVDLPSHIFTYPVNDETSYVTTLMGSKVPSDLQNGNLEINNVDNFFRVAISPEFTDDGIASCVLLENYELGSVYENRVVSYSALQAMSDRYREDYDGLRNDLKVPAIFDFAIVSDMSDVVMEPRFDIPDSAEVQARDYVVEVLDSSGNLRNERITLKIW